MGWDWAWQVGEGVEEGEWGSGVEEGRLVWESGYKGWESEGVQGVGISRRLAAYLHHLSAVPCAQQELRVLCVRGGCGMWNQC
jgi:hypothetical protein